MDGERAVVRSTSFRQLKPVCVALSRISLETQPFPLSELTQCLENIRDVLRRVEYLDNDLANYVFFPLARVFGAADSLPSATLMLALNCLRVLISDGWVHSTDSSLCKQLLILLSFIVEPNTKNNPRSHQSDIVAEAGLECLQGLFLEASSLVPAFCRDRPENFKNVLGHTVASILSCLSNEIGLQVENYASAAIRRLTEKLQAEVLLVDFLPGIVSALTRYMTVRGRPRRSARSIVNAIGAFETTICSTYIPIKPQGQDSTQLIRNESSDEDGRQLTNAIAQVLRLKDHENVIVRRALFKMCLRFLRDRALMLEACKRVCLATAISLCNTLDATDQEHCLIDLQIIVAADPNLLDEFNKLAMDWLNAFPTVVLEENIGKIKKQKNILIACYRLSKSVQSSSQFGFNLFESIRQGITYAMDSLRTSDTSLIQYDGQPAKETTIALFKDALIEFRPLGSSMKTGGVILECLNEVISELAKDPAFVQDALEYLLPIDSASSSEALPTIWFSRTLLIQLAPSDGEIGQLVYDFEAETSQRLSRIDSIYSEAVDILTAFQEPTSENWQLQAVSLEIIALMAQRQGLLFQPELPDVLFPVIEKMGSARVEVRERALTCLNIIAQSSGAGTAGDLIVQNADYLVNDMALRLNGFQISEQAPVVMMIVIQLCGPSIIAYLDDILESIVCALRLYHDSSKLVDALFGILEAMVEQARMPNSRLLETPSRTHIAENLVTLPINQVSKKIADLKKPNSDILEDPPTVLDESQRNERLERVDEHEVVEETSDKPKKLYLMIESIARQSQFYLTHPSAALRQRLLKLLGTASQSLAREEDHYLPLMNDVWPVVISRLHDVDPVVMMEAMQSLTVVFESAGDFLLSRVQAEWPRIIALGKKLKEAGQAQNRGRSGRGKFSIANQQLEGYIDMIRRMVVHVSITSEMEDDLFVIFLDLAEWPQVGYLLERINDDAYWLLRTRLRSIPTSEAPTSAIGQHFRQLTA